MNGVHQSKVNNVVVTTLNDFLLAEVQDSITMTSKIHYFRINQQQKYENSVATSLRASNGKT